MAQRFAAGDTVIIPRSTPIYCGTRAKVIEVRPFHVALCELYNGQRRTFSTWDLEKAP